MARVLSTTARKFPIHRRTGFNNTISFGKLGAAGNVAVAVLDISRVRTMRKLICTDTREINTQLAGLRSQAPQELLLQQLDRASKARSYIDYVNVKY